MKRYMHIINQTKLNFIITLTCSLSYDSISVRKKKHKKIHKKSRKKREKERVKCTLARSDNHRQIYCLCMLLIYLLTLSANF